MTNWVKRKEYKTFPKSDKVNHSKVTFHNRYGITLAAVDFLSVQEMADPGKISIIGICGWGGMALNAACIDTRIKATVTSPMSFAAAMGLARVFHGKKGEQIRLEKFMALSGILCIVSYLMIAAIPVPAVGLLGCALWGLSVGIMWPGAFSMAAKMKGVGTAMFALFTLRNGNIAQNGRYYKPRRKRSDYSTCNDDDEKL